MRQKQKKIFFVVVFVMFLSACVTLESVQKYGTYTQTTIGIVRPVAQDFSDSCLRTNSYKPYVNYSKCESELQASKAILKIANVLNDYGAALSALASDELVSYDADIDGLTKELKNLNIKNLDNQKVTAVGDLAKFIAKCATSAYQQKQVEKFIKESNDSVKNVTNILADIIEKNYRQAVNEEISAWENDYKRVEKEARDKKPIEWASYSQGQWHNREELEKKLNSTSDLAKSIREIGSTHEKLKNDADSLSSKEVAAYVRNFVNEVKPVIQEMQEAFSKK